jgi:hypothetical protein
MTSVVVARNTEQNLSLFIPPPKKGSGLCHACGPTRLILQKCKTENQAAAEEKAVVEKREVLL